MAAKSTELIGWDLHIVNAQVPELDEAGHPVRDESGGVKLAPGKRMTFVDLESGESLWVKFSDENARAIAQALLGTSIRIAQPGEVLH